MVEAGFGHDLRDRKWIDKHRGFDARHRQGHHQHQSDPSQQGFFSHRPSLARGSGPQQGRNI
ncbi:MAG: hypothetical protein ABI216_10430 [Devosia sp.]